MEKLRIGMILDHEFPFDTRVENEALSLIKRGYEVFLFCFSFSEEKLIENYNGIHLWRIPANVKIVKKMRGLVNVVPVYDIYLFGHISRFIKKNNIQLLHVHDLYLLGIALKLKNKFKIPIVVDLHENYVEGLKYYHFANSFLGKLLIRINKWERKEKEWLTQVDQIIVVIEEAKERLQDIGISSNKIHVVPNYLNIENFNSFPIKQKILSKYTNKFIVSYIGAIDYHRGIHIFIKGFSQFQKNAPDALLVIVGGGKILNDLKFLTQQLNIESKVIFLGKQPHEDLPTYITSSQVGCIPHLKTGHTDNTIPHKLFQYMYKKKALLVSDCNPLKRIVNECKCGFYYPHQNSDILSERLLELYKDSKKRAQLGENGHNCVVKKYNWNTSEKNLIELYEIFKG
ncbi:MAG: glycosyltransferase family 4 protein [Promethearchaeota archaeon]